MSSQRSPTFEMSRSCSSLGVKDTDSLLHSEQRSHPSYGINHDPSESTGSSSAGSSNTEVEQSTVLYTIVHHGKERFWSVTIFVLTACLASLSNGVVLGYSSNTLLELGDTYDEGTQTYGIRDGSFMVNLFGSFSNLGAMFGSLFASPLSDRLGRKPALMLGGLPAATGWLMITLAHLAPTRSGFLTVLLLGRFFSGFSAGWFVFCVSVYIAEISSAKTKGLFGACNQLFSTIGNLVVFVLGIFGSSSSFPSFHYYHVSLVALGIIALFEVLMLFTCETPRWLYAKGRSPEGDKALKFLRGPNANISKEKTGIRRALERGENLSFREVLREFKHRSVFQPFILVFFLMFFQQFGGINAAIFYAGNVFEQANVSNAAIVATLSIGVVQLIATFISVILIDYLGRKILLFVSSIGMVIGSSLIGIGFLITYTICKCAPECPDTPVEPVCDHISALGSLAIGGMIIYIIAFALAWGPITWVMMSELLPLRVRSMGGSVETLVNWTFATIVTVSFQPYSRAVTPEATWWSFAFVMFVSIFFVFFFMPETKGHTLEEIEDYFDKGHLFAVGFKGGPAPHQAHKEHASAAKA